MIMTINGIDYRVKFGVGFVRELDKKYYTENHAKTLKFGMGIETQVPLLLTGDIVSLSEFLYLGTYAEEKRPTPEEVDAYIDTHDDIEGLFDSVMEELKKSNATRIKVGELAASLKEEDKAFRKKSAALPKSTKKSS